MGNKIDLRELIGKKWPKLAKIIPNLILKLLEKLFCVKEYNELFEECGDLKGIAFCNATLKHYGTTVKIQGEIPSNGRFLFVANHPFGGIDFVAIASEIAKKHPNIKFIANDFMMGLPQLKDIFVPVNTMGAQSGGNAQAVREAYTSDDQIAIFPAGLVSRKNKKGEIVDLEWKDSFVKKAIRHKRDVVTIRVLGKNSKSFYRASKIRKFLGFKFSWEQLLLPRETNNKKGETLTLIVGETFHWTDFDKRTAQKDAQLMRDYIYTLGPQVSGDPFFI